MGAEEMSCRVRHTKYQPSDSEWKCPKCGNIDNFGVQDSENFSCEKLHATDLVVCGACGFEATGTRVANMLMKIASRKPCPYCKGTGFIQEEAV